MKRIETKTETLGCKTDSRRLASPRRKENLWKIGAFFALTLLAMGSAGAQQDEDVAQTDRTANSSQKQSKKKGDSHAPAAYYGPKQRIAVTDFEIKITGAAGQTVNPNAGGGDVPLPSDLGTGMAEMLATALTHTDRFIVLERKALTDVQTEQALGANPAADPESAAKPGKILGAQVLVRGAVTEFGTRKSSTNLGTILGDIAGSHGSADALVGVDIRLIDAETGQVIAAEHTQGRAHSSGVAFNAGIGKIKLGSSQSDTSPLAKAARQAIDGVVKMVLSKMMARPWEARVADMDSGANGATLFLNAGTADGLKVGDELDIWHPGDPILDPQTRLIIGHKKEGYAGRCRITELTSSLATAQVVEGMGFQKKDIARLHGSSGGDR